MDSTEVAVYGQQEESAYNGHFESTCYHPVTALFADIKGLHSSGQNQRTYIG